MAELVTFFIILFAGLFFSEAFNRLHLPYVTGLIVSGIIVGPQVFNVVQFDELVAFLASIGVVFLMFIAGAEIKTSHLRSLGAGVVSLALVNSIVPFVAGALLTLMLGYSWSVALLMGSIFISSAVAVIVPTLERRNLVTTRLGETILTAAIFQDVASLLLLSFFIRRAAGASVYSTILGLGVALGLLFAIRAVLPRLRKIALRKVSSSDLFEREFQFIFVVLIAAVLVFELLGIEALVAGFLIGMMLSDSIRDRVEHKLHAVAYGLFIPVFFISIGLQVDLQLLSDTKVLILASVVVMTAVTTKLLSGMLGATWIGFKNKERWFVGVALTPHLSTALAAAFAARESELLPIELVTALVVLVLITSFVVPFMLRSVRGA